MTRAPQGAFWDASAGPTPPALAALDMSAPVRDDPASRRRAARMVSRMKAQVKEKLKVYAKVGLCGR